MNLTLITNAAFADPSVTEDQLKALMAEFETALFVIKTRNEKLLELIKECREEIEGLDHGEGAPGMTIYQRQLVRTLDDALANASSQTRPPETKQ